MKGRKRKSTLLFIQKHCYCVGLWVHALKAWLFIPNLTIWMCSIFFFAFLSRGHCQGPHNIRKYSTVIWRATRFVIHFNNKRLCFIARNEKIMIIACQEEKKNQIFVSRNNDVGRHQVGNRSHFESVNNQNTTHSTVKRVLTDCLMHAFPLPTRFYLKERRIKRVWEKNLIQKVLNNNPLFNCCANIH